MNGLALTEQLVARFERFEPDPGPDAAEQYLSDAEYRAVAKSLAAELGEAGLWVFAYGSLIWSPAFEFVEHRQALARGWHRSFCLEIQRWRGSPSQPGLMLALRRGGCCRGIAYRLPQSDRVDQIERLLRREIGRRSSLSTLRWVDVATRNGPVKALTFWAVDTTLPFVVVKPLEDVAATLARACGHIGSGARYLYNTVVSLEEHGIRDRNLWRLQRLVADELRMMVALAGQ